MAKAMERGGMAERRRSLLAGLSGPVLKVGAGDGLNLRHYPASVTRVLAVEPEPTLRRRAEAAAARAPVPVDVADGLAEALPVFAFETRLRTYRRRAVDGVANVSSNLADALGSGPH
jgi:hypothetical protein